MAKRLYYIIIFCLVLAAAPRIAQAQYRISGTIFDSSRHYVLEAVSVLSTNGKGTLTDGDGKYSIDVGEKDSIWFSYLGKPTIKFPVLKILNPMEFDISLQVNATVLKEVKVVQRNYKQDSLQNREDYAKIFNYHKPGLKVATPSYGVGAGFDLDELINVFRFKRNRSMAAFQKRLLIEEQEKYVTHRFNKGLARRLTGLDGPALDSFMIVFRPPFFFTQSAGDYEFQQYIKNAGERFKLGLRPEPFRMPENPEEND